MESKGQYKQTAYFCFREASGLSKDQLLLTCKGKALSIWRCVVQQLDWKMNKIVFFVGIAAPQRLTVYLKQNK